MSPGDLWSYQYKLGFIVLSRVQFIVGNIVYRGTYVVSVYNLLWKIGIYLGTKAKSTKYPLGP